jgi:hypothetical protein
MFTVVKNLQGTVREEEVDGLEYGELNFCIPINYVFFK